MVIILDYAFKLVDCDLGRNRLKFPLNHVIQLASGVDLNHSKSDLVKMYPELREIHPNFNAGDQREYPRLIAV